LPQALQVPFTPSSPTPIKHIPAHTRPLHKMHLWKDFPTNLPHPHQHFGPFTSFTLMLQNKTN
jgi:hypothetical protein